MILEINGLSVGFETAGAETFAVRNVSLAVEAGERLALMGESGCGKSVLALSVMGLLPGNARVGGAVRFAGRDILTGGVVGELRGRELAVCWSNAERFFDPVMTVGEQITEAYAVHHPGEKRRARAAALDLLRRLGFEEPGSVYGRFPFQLSGGMNQRAMIAMSLVNSPRLLFVDEPTRGLDDANRDLLIGTLLGIEDTAMVIITHDVDMAMRTAGRFLMMRRGELIDGGLLPEGLAGSEHPYTRRLVDCAFRLPGPEGTADDGGPAR